MKQPIKTKDNDPCSGSLPLHHYIITNKKYRKYEAVHFFVISWFTHAIEQMDKSTALIKAVQPTDYYRQ